MASADGSKTDTVVKLVLVFFISLLSFSIGTFVGKKFSDNQHRLAQYEPSTEESTHVQPEEGEKHREVASVQNAEVKPKEVLSDQEIAKLAEEFISEEGTQEQEPAPAHLPEAPHVVEKAEPLPAATRMASGHPPTAEETKTEHSAQRVPVSLPQQMASTTIGKYTVQVASYASEPEAQKVAEDLKQKGFSAFYIPATIKGRTPQSVDKTWYRVSVGLFTTQKEADSYKKELMTKAKIGSPIVQKIQ